MEESESQNIYSKLRAMRRVRGLTVDKLAEKIGENSQKIGRIERGKSNLTVDYLLKLSKALEISPDTIFKEETVKETSPNANNDLLSEIILQVEKQAIWMQESVTPEQKAQFISFLFSKMSQIPAEHRKFFLNIIFESLKFFKTQAL